MHPAGYYLARSPHRRPRHQAGCDALARASRQTGRRGEGQPAPSPACTAQASRP
jgi:hypothetical protein